jgi:hypothetical protein
MCERIRPNRRRRILLLLWIVFWLLISAIAAVVILAPTARADDLTDDEVRYIIDHGPQVCAIITNHPDRGGLLTAAAAIIADGWDTEQTSRVLAYSIIRYCPQWVPLVKAVAAQGKQTYT